MTFSPALVAQVMASNRPRLLETLAKVQAVTAPLNLIKDNADVRR